MPARKPSARKTSPKPPRPSLNSNTVSFPAGPSIREMFNDIAPGYDRFNAIASLGLHQHWRRAMVRRIPLGARVLDIASGTGDVAFMAADNGHEVVGLDFSENMLAKAREKDSQGRIRWMTGSADSLPFSDSSFSCITSAFALRNLRPCLDKALQESFRILKPGGTVLHLDFGRPKAALLRWGHRIHLSYAIPLIGKWFCGQKWPEGYLENTIERFYEPSEVLQKLELSGFRNLRHSSLLFGVVQLFEGKKI